MENLPVPGRTYESTLEIPEPTASSRLLDGPMTEWHSNGRVKSHGRFVAARGRSAPHGIWSFWYSSGERLSLGQYQQGKRVGCFGRWDERGNLFTYLVEGDQLRAGSCEVSSDPAADRLAETYASGAATGRSLSERSPPVVILGLGSMLSPSRLSVQAEHLVPASGGLRASYWMSLRHNWRWLSLALAHGQWWTDTDGTSTVSFGFLPGVRMSHGARVSSEASIEIGGRRYTVIPTAPGGAAAARTRFFTWYGGLRAGAGVALTSYLTVHAAGFWQRDLHREVAREHVFESGGVPLQGEVDWDVGSQIFGALLELRIGIR